MRRKEESRSLSACSHTGTRLLCNLKGKKCSSSMRLTFLCILLPSKSSSTHSSSKVSFVIRLVQHQSRRTISFTFHVSLQFEQTSGSIEGIDRLGRVVAYRSCVVFHCCQIMTMRVRSISLFETKEENVDVSGRFRSLPRKRVFRLTISRMALAKALRSSCPLLSSFSVSPF